MTAWPKQAQRELADRVCNAVAEVVPELIRHTRTTPGFDVIGSRMLVEWREGLERLRLRITVPVPDIATASAQAAIVVAEPAATHVPERIGASPLMVPRGRQKPPPPS